MKLRFGHGVEPPSYLVKRFAKRVGGSGELDTASLVEVDSSVTVGVESSPVVMFLESPDHIRGKGDLPRLRLAEDILRHRTSRGSMQSCLIYLIQIDTWMKGVCIDDPERRGGR